MEQYFLHSNEVLAKHVLLILLEYLQLLTLFLVLSVEGFMIFYQNLSPVLMIIPLCCVLAFQFMKLKCVKNHPVYLVDFSCLKPPNFCRVPFSAFLEHASKIESFNQESVLFMEKVLYSSGQSQQTYLPPPLHFIPPKTHQSESLSEVYLLLFPVFENLLSKTSLCASKIDILIVNCSGFCPAPSLASILVNKFKLRSNIKSYNLSGMGCSAGSLAVDLANNLLRIHSNCNAVVLSTEILSTGWYSGNDKSMLLLNCHFRMGSAAILLTNRKAAANSAKYKLFRSLRSHSAANDSAYNVVFRTEDSNGITGVMLNKDSLHVARDVIKTHLLHVGSSILPVAEKIRYMFSVFIKKLPGGKIRRIYVPDFTMVVQHFCLPTSGKQVIREVGKGIGISEKEMEVGLMTMQRFGNQSSSALWYELAYIEAKDRVKKGDKVWQLGMGSGTKCNSVIWECIRPIVGESENGPWADCIDNYPIFGSM